MIDVLAACPVTVLLQSHIEASPGVLVRAPRFHGKHRFLKWFADRGAADRGRTPVLLCSPRYIVESKVSYRDLWEATRTQLTTAKRRAKDGTVDTQDAYLDAVRGLLAGRTNETLFLLAGVPSGEERAHESLLLTVQTLILRAPNLSVRVLAVDDYVLRFFGSRSLEVKSPLVFREFRYDALTPEEIFQWISSLAGEDVAGRCCPELMTVTEGHVGLVLSIVDDLIARKWVLEDNVGAQFRALLYGSDAFNKILRVLQEDPVGLSTTALKYQEPEYPEFSSPRIETLIGLGILRPSGPTKLRLRGGLVGTLIRELNAAASRPQRLGRVVPDFGDVTFHDGEMQLEEGDFVVVHLSDIHVGGDFQFQLSWKGGAAKLGSSRLPELIANDLAMLSLGGRIDAVVITGDLVCSGSDAEYRRFEEVFRDLIKVFGVGSERVAVLPGNHDVQWSVDSFAEAGVAKGVSNESFRTCLRLLGKEPAENGASMIEAVSRDGKNVLRIVGLDSNFVEGPEAAGIGYIGRDCLEGASRLLRGVGPARTGVSVMTWVGVHHHVVPVGSADVDAARARRVSVMGNAAELLSWMTRNRAEVLLHGHAHQPAVNVIRRWPIEGQFRFHPFAVIGAGSVGAKRDRLGAFSRNQYYVLVRQRDRLLVRSRAMGDEGLAFTSHADLSVGLGDGNRGGA